MFKRIALLSALVAILSTPALAGSQRPGAPEPEPGASHQLRLASTRFPDRVSSTG